MLQAHLEVNGVYIGSLIMRNTGRVAPPHEILYRCGWMMDDGEGKYGICEHNRADGAMVLVEKAIKSLRKNGNPVFQERRLISWVNGGGFDEDGNIIDWWEPEGGWPEDVGD